MIVWVDGHPVATECHVKLFLPCPGSNRSEKISKKKRKSVENTLKKYLSRNTA
jgi:hypothetical protein